MYVPTNRGLRFVREQGLKRLQEERPEMKLDMQECRGEEIPRRVYFAEKSVAGITGQDLFEEFRCTKEWAQLPHTQRRRLSVDTKYTSLGLTRKGEYEKSVFGLPALCVLGKGGMTLENYAKRYKKNEQSGALPYADDEIKPSDSGFSTTMVKRRDRIPNLSKKRVVIPQRYENLIRDVLEWKAKEAKFLALDGLVDVTAATDDTIDYAIDIVLTGKTCRKYGLGIFEVIYRSDGVLLQKNELRQERSISTDIDQFTLWLNTGRTFHSGGGSHDYPFAPH